MKKGAKLLWPRNAICVAIGAVLGLALSASAQDKGAALPVGFWVTKPASEQLFISTSTCRFTANNASGVTVQLIEGKCTWQASSDGGILTINNIHSYKSAPIRYSIVLVNSTTIKVFGDVFYKGILGTVK